MKLIIIMHAVIQLTAKAKLNLNKTSLNGSLRFYKTTCLPHLSFSLYLSLYTLHACCPSAISRLGNIMSRHVHHRKTCNINEVVLSIYPPFMFKLDTT